MKNIRLGNDISIKWYVYRMNTPEDFNGKTVEVHLLDKNDVKQNFSYKIEDGLIDGVFYGKNQITTGSYRLVLVENAGNNNMVTLDYVDAFVLNSKMHNTTSSGSDTVCNMKTQIVNLTSIMSSKTGATNLYDYYTREEVDEILNGYAKAVDLQSYALKEHTHDEYAKAVDLESYALKTDIPDTSYYLTSESDPTVPAYVKSIRQSDIDAWNAATGGVDLSNYVTKNELGSASYITADQVTHPDYSNTYAPLVHTHNQYLTEHQKLPDYSSTYAPVNHTHNQYADKQHTHSEYLKSESDPTVPAYVKSIKQSDIDAWNAATGGVDLSNYVTKNELGSASYITADQVTYPDYSNTYANIVHSHSEYAKSVDLQSYALKTELFSKDYNDLTNKPTIPSEYDDTQVRNLIAGKQDKLTESQIANLNADHSKYLTEHQTLPDYSNTYAAIAHTHSEYLKSESDPTVPAYVKSIKQSDIDAWNAATGGVDLSNYVTKNELDTASYITADQVTHPDYSNTYAPLEHTHDQYAGKNHIHTDYSDKGHTHPYYAAKEHSHSNYAEKSHTHSQYANINHTHDQYALKTELFSKDYNDLTNKPTIPEEYDDTAVRNLIAGKQDKLSSSQIANLNADHSKYLTKHQTLPDYSSTYAPLVHSHSNYALKDHTHNQYAAVSHTHSEYAKAVDLQSYATLSYLNDKLGSIDTALTNILEA